MEMGGQTLFRNCNHRLPSKDESRWVYLVNKLLFNKPLQIITEQISSQPCRKYMSPTTPLPRRPKIWFKNKAPYRGKKKCAYQIVSDGTTKRRANRLWFDPFIACWWWKMYRIGHWLQWTDIFSILRSSQNRDFKIWRRKWEKLLKANHRWKLLHKSTILSGNCVL